MADFFHTTYWNSNTSDYKAKKTKAEKAKKEVLSLLEKDGGWYYNPEELKKQLNLYYVNNVSYKSDFCRVWESVGKDINKLVSFVLDKSKKGKKLKGILAEIQNIINDKIAQKKKDKCNQITKCDQITTKYSEWYDKGCFKNLKKLLFYGLLKFCEDISIDKIYEMAKFCFGLREGAVNWMGGLQLTENSTTENLENFWEQYAMIEDLKPKTNYRYALMTDILRYWWCFSCLQEQGFGFLKDNYERIKNTSKNIELMKELMQFLRQCIETYITPQGKKPIKIYQ